MSLSLVTNIVPEGDAAWRVSLFKTLLGLGLLTLPSLDPHSIKGMLVRETGRRIVQPPGFLGNSIGVLDRYSK
jgi:hypothetical protein